MRMVAVGTVPLWRNDMKNVALALAFLFIATPGFAQEKGDGDDVTEKVVKSVTDNSLPLGEGSVKLTDAMTVAKATQWDDGRMIVEIDVSLPNHTVELHNLN